MALLALFEKEVLKKELQFVGSNQKLSELL